MAESDSNIDLIFTVVGLARMFEESGSLDDFLQRVCETVAEFMDASVASVYLTDEEGEDLVLRATVGLASDSVGSVRLGIGEGITGLALEELRPVREDRGKDNPQFRFFPGIKEEEYEAFLAVPIVHGLRRLGVLTVQHEEPGYFTKKDTKSLSAIASELASAIENSELLSHIDRLQSGTEAPDSSGDCPDFIQGTSISSGFASGKATVLKSDPGEYLRRMVDRSGEMDLDIDDFETALDRTESQISELERRLVEQLGDPSAAQIFTAHRFMLRDEHLAGAIRRRITGGAEVSESVMAVIDEYLTELSQSTNPVLQDRTQDLQDLGYRLLSNLTGEETGVRDYRNKIIIARDLMPSDIFKLTTQGAGGVVLISGSPSSHVSILGRSLDVPMVIAEENKLFNLDSQTDVIVDADQGNVFVNPDEEVRSRYRDLKAAREEATGSTSKVEPKTFTDDGTRIRLLANINLCSDLPVARRLNAEGVGLYRSEFPFLIRNEFPSEEDQFRVYRRILEEMGDRPVTFRTLDIGGDKRLSYAPGNTGSNPFMGLRSIRFSLQNRSLFSQQLRAMLRAAHDRPLRIMFPLVGSVDDLAVSRRLVKECQRSLAEQGMPYCRDDLEIGIMVELPSAVELIEELAGEADFMSIGTNDLVQYLLAVDRTNPEMQEFYRAHHPAVLRALARIAEAARKNDTPVSVCGESAADTSMLPFLIGVGLRDFSLDPRNIPGVQAFLQDLDIKKAEAQAERLLGMNRIDKVEEVLGATNPGS